MSKAKYFLLAAVAMAFALSQALTKEKISGVSQKGPFVKGSATTLAELGGNLAQTTKVFLDKRDNACLALCPSQSGRILLQ